MADAVGIKIFLEGAPKFKEDLDSIDNGLKVNRSEMKLTDAQYGKNTQSIESFTAKNLILEKTIASQSDKVSLLQDRLQKAAKAYGEADQRTMDLQTKFNNAGAELARLKGQFEANSQAVNSMTTGLNSVENQLQANRSGLELVNAQYGENERSIEALTAKNQALEKVIQSQSEKVNLLGQKLKESAAAYGEADQRTTDLQISFNKASAELLRLKKQFGDTVSVIERINNSTVSYEGQLKALNAQMNYVDAQFSENRNSIEAYQAKNEILNKTIDVQKAKLADLSEQLDQAIQTYGEADDRTLQLKESFYKTSAAMINTETELKNNQSAMNDLTVAEAASIDQAEGFNKIKFDKLKDQIGSLSEKMEGVGKKFQDIGGSMSKYITAPVLGGFGLVTKGTEGLRSDLSKLENNAKLSGVSFDILQESMRSLVAITGETDSSVEALSNLLQADFKGNNITTAVQLLEGAVLQFPDTIKIESLADSLQETIATKEPTGQFAELLGRLGINTEKFTEGLQRSARAGNEQKYILGVLAKSTLPETTKSYLENNKALIAGREATYDMKLQLADLGDKFQPLLNKLTEFATTVLDKFNSMDNKTQDVILAFIAIGAAIGPALSGIGTATLGVSGLVGAFGKMAPMGAAAFAKVAGEAKLMGGAFAAVAGNPVTLLVAGIVAIIGTLAQLYQTNDTFKAKVDDMCSKAQEKFQGFDNWLGDVFAVDWSERFGSFGDIMNGFSKNAENMYEAGKRQFGGIITFLKGVFTNDWNAVWQGVSDTFGGMWDGMVALAKAPINGIIALINSLISGVNSLIENLNKIKIDVPDWVPLIGGNEFKVNIPTIPKIDYLAKGGFTDAGWKIVGEKGPELVAFQSPARVFTAEQTRTIFSGAQNDNPSCQYIFQSGSIVCNASTIKELNDLIKMAKEAVQARRAR